MPSSARPVVGEVYKRELLHSEATYRVVGVEDDHVDVETIDVPGLPAGFRMRLTPGALAAMRRVSAPAAAVESESRQERAARERRLRMA